MNQLERRLERLEQRMGLKRERRFIYIMPNLEEEEDQETPYKVKISRDRWAHALAGGPFTAEEIRGLKEEYADERSGNDPQTKN